MSATQMRCGGRRQSSGIRVERQCPFQCDTERLGPDDLPVRKLSVIRKEVFSSQFLGIHADRSRDFVHMGLTGEACLRHAHAAHCAAAFGVGQDKIGIRMDVGNVIRSGCMDGCFLQLGFSERKISTGVCANLNLLRQQPPVLCYAGFVVKDVRMSTRCDADVLLTGQHHSHGTPGFQSQEGDPGLNDDFVFPSEAPADPGGPLDLQTAHRNVEYGAQHADIVKNA